MRTKDGRTLRYGTTDAARLTYSGGCHTWMLCEVTDLQGRYIRYNYAKDANNNEIRLASIEYTGTPSLAPKQRVEFTYGLRSDRWTGSTGPLKQAKTLLLTRIDVKGNGTFAWSYLLHYQLLQGRSCLASVQKIAPDGSELNSTELLWDYPDKMQENYAASLPDWKTRPGQYQVRHFSGDFDGDGISDILTTKWNNSLIETDENVCTFTLGGVDGMTRTTTYSLPRNQLFDRFDQILDERGCSGNMASVDFDQLSYGLQHLQDVLAADYDGDGIAEMMFVCMEYDMNFETIIQQGICEAVTQPDFPLSKYTLPTGRYYCLVYSFKDRKFVHKTTTYSDFLPEYRATDRVNTFRFDFDNDGRSELLDGRDIYQLQGSNLVQIGRSDTDMSAHLVNTWGDFNGDGLMDFVSRSGYVYEREYGNYHYRYAGRITDKAILGVTDYDQDGEDELIVFDLYDSIHVVRRNDMLPSEYQHMLITYESEGYHVDFYCDAGYQYPWTEGMTEYWDGHRKVPITYIYMYAAKNNGKGMRIYDKEGNEQGEVEMKLFWDLTHVLNADIDNDGREDIVCFDDDMVRCIYYRTDDNYRREDITLSTGDDYFFGDYNGDGSIDLLSASNNRWWTFLNGYVPQPTLYAVRDGMGLRSEITYRPLTDPAVYAKGSGATYPTLDLAGPVWVVTRIARDNGVAGTQVEHYAYRGAKANLHGKGFFGFSTVTVTDSVPGTTMTTTTTYDDRCGLPLSSTQTTDMGGKTTQQTATYTIEAVNEAQKRYRQRLASRQETDLSGNVVNTTYAEDAWGNPTRETVNYGGGVTAETRTWYRTVDTADRYVCLPDSQTVTRTRGGRHWVEGVRYTYDADCRPLGQVTHTGYRPTATEEYAYNAQGFVAEVKSKPYASNHWLTTTYEYDDRGRVAKETDPLGLSTTYEYDDIGLPLSSTDARGNETSYTYDGFGRRITTRQPDGVTRTEQLMWYTDTDAPDGTLYYVQSAATGHGCGKRPSPPTPPPTAGTCTATTGRTAPCASRTVRARRTCGRTAPTRCRRRGRACAARSDTTPRARCCQWTTQAAPSATTCGRTGSPTPSA